MRNQTLLNCFSLERNARGSQKENGKNIKKDWIKLNSLHFDIQAFDGGIEFRLKGQNKGNVIKEILAKEPSVEEIAYFGDDLTDEDAFSALKNSGLKIIVRPVSRPTLADIQLMTPDEVLMFLIISSRSIKRKLMDDANQF
ncbi:MAG: hypothetical protein HWD61_15225 [Parachlamydiaceae bacterium]|nr:MAG: hypothetical protein HWD61_15225 [Parachlamydiaceae bacterium]